MTHEEAGVMLTEFAAKIGEYFDAVQILASWTEDGCTYCQKRGTGNWYARVGMAHQFIDSDVAEETAIQIAERIKGDDPDE